MLPPPAASEIVRPAEACRSVDHPETSIAGGGASAAWATKSPAGKDARDKGNGACRARPPGLARLACASPEAIPVGATATPHPFRRTAAYRLAAAMRQPEALPSIAVEEVGRAAAERNYYSVLCTGILGGQEGRRTPSSSRWLSLLPLSPELPPPLPSPLSPLPSPLSPPHTRPPFSRRTRRGRTTAPGTLHSTALGRVGRTPLSSCSRYIKKCCPAFSHARRCGKCPGAPPNARRLQVATGTRVVRRWDHGSMEPAAGGRTDVRERHVVVG